MTESTAKGSVIPSFVEYITLSGVRLHIVPLNVPTIVAINNKAADKFKYPDPTPYQKPLENAVPGMMSAPEDDPEYLTACSAIDTQREVWVNRVIFDYCVSYADFKNREDVQAFYADRLTKLREIATLPENDWEATLFHIILTGNDRKGADRRGGAVNSDYNKVVTIAIQAVALTGGEVLNGLRLFRAQI